MEKKGNRRAQILHLLVYLFMVLMVIPLIMVFKNIFDFEGRAQAMTDAIKVAENFKKDYTLALYAPVNNITVCYQLPRLDPCRITMRSALASNIDPSASNKYAPVVYVRIEDPPWNATVVLDLMVYGRYGALGQTSLDVIGPRINATDCWTDTIETINYKYCSLNCTSPIRITKIRHYSAWVNTIIDNISVEQGAGGC